MKRMYIAVALLSTCILATAAQTNTRSAKTLTEELNQFSSQSKIAMEETLKDLVYRLETFAKNWDALCKGDEIIHAVVYGSEKNSKPKTYNDLVTSFNKHFEEQYEQAREDLERWVRQYGWSSDPLGGSAYGRLIAYRYVKNFTGQKLKKENDLTTRTSHFYTEFLTYIKKQLPSE